MKKDKRNYELRFEAVFTDNRLRNCFQSFLNSKNYGSFRCLSDNNDSKDTDDPRKLRQLKEDLFPRFVRSKQCAKFLDGKEKNYILSIAQDITNRNLSTHFRQHDPFTGKYITDNDIKFILDSVVDRAELMTIGTSDQEFKAYYYDKNMNVAGGKENFTFYKFTGYLPCSARQFVNIFADGPSRYKWDKNLKRRNLVDYIQMDETIPYSCVLLDYEIKFPLFFKNRRNLILMTLLYDTERHLYMFMCKSTIAYPEKMEIFTNTVLWDSVLAYMFYEIDDHKCRYVNSLYVNMNIGALAKKQLIRKLKKRAKEMYEGFMSSINNVNEKPEEHQRVLDTFDEFTERYLTGGRTKTWEL
jgi:hypothetical protein